jgi:hypothetical protein
MLPPAPGLFSTTTFWPHVSLNFCAIPRPTTSSGPPGGKGTTRRAGRDGNACAIAGSVPVATTPAIAAAATRRHVARRKNACDRRAETSGFNMDKTGKSDRRRV